MQPGFSACGVFLNRISQANKNRSHEKACLGKLSVEAGQRRRSNRVDRDREGGHGSHDPGPHPGVFSRHRQKRLISSVSASRRRGAGAATRLLGHVWSTHSSLPGSSSAVSLSSRQWVTGQLSTTLVISFSSEIVM